MEGLERRKGRRMKTQITTAAISDHFQSPTKSVPSAPHTNDAHCNIERVYVRMRFWIIFLVVDQDVNCFFEKMNYVCNIWTNCVWRMEWPLCRAREPCFDFLFDTSRNIPNVRVFSSKAMVQNFYCPRPHVEIKITLNLVLIPDSPSTWYLDLRYRHVN